MNAAVLAAIVKARLFFVLGGLAWLAGLVPTAGDRALLAVLVAVAVAVEITLDGHRPWPARARTSRQDLAA